MIKPERFSFERDQGELHAHADGNDLLYHFEFNQGKWTAISPETHAASRYLEDVLEEGYLPADQDDREDAKAFEPAHPWE